MLKNKYELMYSDKKRKNSTLQKESIFIEDMK